MADPTNNPRSAQGHANRLDWFLKARFGMFIHWGLYALLGQGEWAMNRQRIPLDEYLPLADQFKAENYRPREWAKLARQAGMKYMVLTSKHHEGFCLWDSKICKFNAVNSAAKRDLLAEYVEAVRAEGLKVGLYYSLGDWRHPDWFAGWQGDDAARERFMDWTHDIVRELMSNYGQIDILWYDLPQNYTPMQWRSVELNAMVRQLQPQILINNRAYTTEDFATPEQHLTAIPVNRPWEICMTLNDNWGYCPADLNYKTPREVALTLATASAGGGNLLLNVGPDGTGRIPEESQKILQSVGQWLKRNAQAVYPGQRFTISFNQWGPTTIDGFNMYLHLKTYQNKITIGGLIPQVRRASILSTGQELTIQRRPTQTILTGLPERSPDEVLTVIHLELDGPPDQDIGRIIGGADFFPVLPA